MSTISPMQLRRTMSYPSQPFDDTQGVDPGQLFAVDPWSLSPAGPGRKLHCDPHAVAPETPLRKMRNHSVAVADTGLVTPQSVSRSFSTSSLPFAQHDMADMGHHALPSPVMTPLTTPLATPMGSNDNPLDLAYEKDTMSIPLGMNANYNFDLGFAHPVAPGPPSGLDDPGMASGINPFYRPPVCLQRPESPGATEDPDNHISALAEFAATAAATPVGSLSPSEAGPLDAGSELGSTADAAAAAAAAAIAAGHPDLLHVFKPASDHDHEHDHEHALLRRHSSVHDHEHSSGDVSRDEPGLDQSPHSYDLKALAPSEAMPGMYPLGDVQFSMQSQSPFMYPAPATQGVSNVTKKKPATTRSRSSSASSTASSTAGDAGKPFACESCSKSFRRMEHLRRHMKTHTMERPYVCTIPDCGRKFSRSDNLKAHILTHAKKSGRNVYVEGLVETHKVTPVKRRKSKTANTQIPV